MRDPTSLDAVLHARRIGDGNGGNPLPRGQEVGELSEESQCGLVHDGAIIAQPGGVRDAR